MPNLDFRSCISLSDETDEAVKILKKIGIFYPKNENTGCSGWRVPVRVGEFVERVVFNGCGSVS